MISELSGLPEFVNALADAAADSIMPHFRAPLSVESKGAVGLRSGDHRRPQCRDRHAPPDQSGLPRPRHRRRGARQRTAGRRLRLGARPDRRHPRLHHRPAGVGHADRPPPPGPAGLRHDGPGLHPRALLRATAAMPGIADRTARRRRCATRAGGQIAEAALFTTTPALFRGADRTAYDRVEAAVRLARYGMRLLRLLHGRRRPCRPGHRGRVASPTTSSR